MYHWLQWFHCILGLSTHWQPEPGKKFEFCGWCSSIKPAYSNAYMHSIPNTVYVEILPGEHFTNFATCSRWRKFYHATFFVLCSRLHRGYDNFPWTFLQYKGSWAWWNFIQRKILHIRYIDHLHSWVSPTNIAASAFIIALLWLMDDIKVQISRCRLNLWSL